MPTIINFGGWFGSDTGDSDSPDTPEVEDMTKEEVDAEIEAKIKSLRDDVDTLKSSGGSTDGLKICTFNNISAGNTGVSKALKADIGSEFTFSQLGVTGTLPDSPDGILVCSWRVYSSKDATRYDYVDVTSVNGFRNGYQIGGNVYYQDPKGDQSTAIGVRLAPAFTLDTNPASAKVRPAINAYWGSSSTYSSGLTNRAIMLLGFVFVYKEAAS